MNIDTAGIEAIVKKVLSSIDGVETADAPGAAVVDGKDGIFQDIDAAIEAANAAWDVYKMAPLILRYKIIEEIRKVFTKKEVVETVAHMAVEETGMGNYDDKVKKAYVCKFVDRKSVV